MTTPPLFLRPLFLRRSLQIDALLSGGCGLLLAGAAGPLGGLLGLPAALLFWAGLALLPWAAALLWIARPERPARGAVAAVIALNLLWGLGCLALLMAGWGALLGQAFLLAQAAFVGCFAALQARGLRQVAAAVGA